MMCYIRHRGEDRNPWAAGNAPVSGWPKRKVERSSSSPTAGSRSPDSCLWRQTRMRATNSSTMVNSSRPLPQELASAWRPCQRAATDAHPRWATLRAVIYLDTSATVKLVTAEQESPALINWLNDHPDEHLATSAIGHIELIRAATRAGAAATAAAARTVASTIDTLVLTDTIAAIAATIPPAELRTPGCDPPGNRARPPAQPHGLLRLRPTAAWSGRISGSANRLSAQRRLSITEAPASPPRGLRVPCSPLPQDSSRQPSSQE
jgi:hypothetical protein